MNQAFDFPSMNATELSIIRPQVRDGMMNMLRALGNMSTVNYHFSCFSHYYIGLDGKVKQTNTASVLQTNTRTTQDAKWRITDFN